jgi:hypothetical protein
VAFVTVQLAWIVVGLGMLYRHVMVVLGLVLVVYLLLTLVAGNLDIYNLLYECTCLSLALVTLTVSAFRSDVSGRVSAYRGHYSAFGAF